MHITYAQYMNELFFVCTIKFCLAMLKILMPMYFLYHNLLILPDKSKEQTQEYLSQRFSVTGPIWMGTGNQFVIKLSV